MKKLILILVCLPMIGFAQINPCVPNMELQDLPFGLWPDTIENLVEGEVNVYYEEYVQIKTPTTAGEVQAVPTEYSFFSVDSIGLIEVQGLPNGIEISCSTPSCIYNGDEVGCVTIYGTPTEVGVFDLTFILDGWITMFDEAFSMSDIVDYVEIEGYKLIVNQDIISQDINGQWYSEEEGEYVTFTSDSIFMHSLENGCYEFLSMSYEIQSDTSFIATQEYQGMSFAMEVVYAINNDNLTIVIDQEGDIEQYNYVSTSYDPSIIPLCSDFYTWICDNSSSCVEVEEGSGEFANQEECEWQCFSGEVTYECWDGDCYEFGDFGSYQSYEDCINVCDFVDTTSVTYNCVIGSCVESFFGEGEFDSIEECEEQCGNNNQDQTYECVLGACYENPLGNGTYASLEDCETECITSSITNLNNNKKLKKITNLLGQETPIRKNTAMFYIYDDGTVEKKIIVE